MHLMLVQGAWMWAWGSGSMSDVSDVTWHWLSRYLGKPACQNGNEHHRCLWGQTQLRPRGIWPHLLCQGGTWPWTHTPHMTRTCSQGITRSKSCVDSALWNLEPDTQTARDVMGHHSAEEVMPAYRQVTGIYKGHANTNEVVCCVLICTGRLTCPQVEYYCIRAQVGGTEQQMLEGNF